MKSRANRRRHWVWRGGSVSMKLRRASRTSGSIQLMRAAPFASDENVRAFFSTCTTSWYFVTHQKPSPSSGPGCQ